jgi:hypothetical protein
MKNGNHEAPESFGSQDLHGEEVGYDYHFPALSRKHSCGHRFADERSQSAFGPQPQFPAMASRSCTWWISREKPDWATNEHK